MKVIATMTIRSTMDNSASRFIVFEGRWDDGRPEAVFIAPEKAGENIERGDMQRATYFADNALEAMDVLARKMDAHVSVEVY